LGCWPCTGRIKSNATTIDEIIDELRNTNTSERAGRAQDHEDTYAMQKLRAKGYM
jgi:sulfate adenylyltransferase subunit 2